MAESKNMVAEMVEALKGIEMKYNVCDILGADGRHCRHELTLIEP